jgi:tetratricopeptide (TPR) repeat protein
MVRHQSRVLALAAVMLFCGSPSASNAFQGGALGRGANPNAPQLVVVNFNGGADKKLGVDFAEKVRDKIGGDVSYRDLLVQSKQNIDATLQASGYDMTAPLSPGDANLLAKQLRADFYIDGKVTKGADNKSVTVEAYLTLTNPQDQVQPLGKFDGKSVDDAASQVSKAFQQANKVSDEVKKCIQARRENNLNDATAAATAGIAKFPRSTLLRICQLAVMVDQKKPPADVLKLTNDILQIDPKSKVALQAQVDAYDQMGDKANKAKVLVALLASDPTNQKLQQAVVYEYAQSGNYAEALKLVAQMMTDNPGDVNFVKLDWQLLFALKEYKQMGSVGEQMIQLDTSLADTTYFDRTMEAYRTDSNWTKTAQTAALATKKYAKRADYWAQRGQAEQKAGQIKEAVASLKHALTIDPNIKGARLIIISAMVDANEYDSANVSMRDAIKNGENVDQIGTFAITIASKLFKTANDTKPPALAPWQKVLPAAAYADSLLTDRNQKNLAVFEMGVTHYYVATLMYPDVVAQKDCKGANTVQDALLAAGTELPRGGASNPAAVGQLMPAIQQMATAVDQAVKVFCAPPKKPPQF